MSALKAIPWTNVEKRTAGYMMSGTGLMTPFQKEPEDTRPENSVRRLEYDRRHRVVAPISTVEVLTFAFSSGPFDSALCPCGPFHAVSKTTKYANGRRIQ